MEKNIGDRLKTARKTRNMTLDQASRVINISKTYVSEIERGDKTNISPVVIAAIDKFIEQASVIGTPVSKPTRTIPVISKVQAGENGYWDDCYPVGEGSMRIDCPPNLLDPNAFAVQVEGDSMHPRFMHGEFVIVDTSKPVSNGNDVVVKLNDGSVMIKKLRKYNGTTVLESWNSAYEPIQVDDKDIVCCYKVVDHKPL